MHPTNIGDLLNRIVNSSRTALFLQGELAQLTYGAFDVAATNIQANKAQSITIEFPVGYRPNREPIQSERTYQKNELLERYQFLAFQQLPVNCVVHLVTTVEALLSDIVRLVISKYPKKLGIKRTVSLELILQASSLDEVHIRATDALINELSYLPPAEFADQMERMLSINLRECSAFHRYIELKATRDIYIHNKGLANDIYLRKAGTHARVRAGESIPVDIVYFLESYEACLQLTEWLEEELHQQWHSSELENRRNKAIEARENASSKPPEKLLSLGTVGQPNRRVKKPRRSSKKLVVRIERFEPLVSC